MLIDDVKIKVKAGRGGNGLATFSKVVLENGPTGGDGGQGGNVIVKGVTDLGALRQFQHKKNVKANNGKDGGASTRTGANGKDAIILVPIGTVVHNLVNGDKYEVVNLEDEFIIARGGNGGFGNYHYRSSRHTTPDRANDGAEGDEFEIRLELKLIADVGLIGYPNVGKSTFLNTFTSAKSKVANYQFTTLEPHLGVYYGLILADIPGLIEGASAGKGLGHKFLQHIERTKMLFHFIAADSIDPVNDYLIIRKELGEYNKKMLKKKEWIILSRTDEVKPAEAKKIKEKLKKYNPQIVELSVLDDKSVAEMKKFLNKIKSPKSKVEN
jgi:GTP-binding protein